MRGEWLCWCFFFRVSLSSFPPPVHPFPSFSFSKHVFSSYCMLYGGCIHATIKGCLWNGCERIHCSL